MQYNLAFADTIINETILEKYIFSDAVSSYYTLFELDVRRYACLVILTAVQEETPRYANSSCHVLSYHISM